MNFREYVTGKSLNLKGYDKIDILNLVSFLQDNTDITKLDMENCNIGDEGAKALAELTNLTSLNLSFISYLLIILLV